jgi:cell surface protein SprA
MYSLTPATHSPVMPFKLTVVFWFILVVSGYSQVNNYYDLKSFQQWHICAIPAGQTGLFPESGAVNDRTIGFNRAKLCWYVIDPLFYDNSLCPAYLTEDTAQMKNHFVRAVWEKELFPENPDFGGHPIMLVTLNLAYYPGEKGAYNFDVAATQLTAGIDSSGTLKDPGSRWAGIYRSLQKNIFSLENMNYLRFWLMDPFVYNHNGSGGTLCIHIGNVSEDVLKDRRNSYENGLPVGPVVDDVDTTIWGRVPSTSQTYFAFDQGISWQDVGLDGMNDVDERSFNQGYLLDIANRFGVNSKAYQDALRDPSSDNFHYFRGCDYDTLKTGLLCRYKKYNGTEDNTTGNPSEPYPTLATVIPDFEDINMNGVLDTAENYFQYKVILKPGNLVEGQNFVTEKRTVYPANGNGAVNWYKFHIPINSDLRETIGSIATPDSAGFIRLVLKDFSDSVILRFATLELVTADSIEPPYFPGNSDILVYPNPSAGIVNILLKNEILEHLRVSDMTGRIIYSFEINQSSPYYSIDLSQVSSGYYLIHAVTGTNTYHRKVLIRKQ